MLRAKLFKGNTLFDTVEYHLTQDGNPPDVIYHYAEQYYFNGIQDNYAHYQHSSFCDKSGDCLTQQQLLERAQEGLDKNAI